jgi:hypothetical protein
MAGAREHRESAVYPRNEAALRHDAGPPQDTDNPYGPYPEWQKGSPASCDGLPFER